MIAPCHNLRQVKRFTIVPTTSEFSWIVTILDRENPGKHALIHSAYAKEVCKDLENGKTPVLIWFDIIVVS